MWHFLKCAAPAQQLLFNQLHRGLQQLHIKYNIDPYLFQLLWQGLLSIQMSTEINQQLANYPHNTNHYSNGNTKSGGNSYIMDTLQFCSLTTSIQLQKEK